MITGIRLAIRRLAERHPELTQACVARVLGVSRETVSYMAREEGLRFRPHRQPNVLISWPCPGCDGEAQVQVQTKMLRVKRTAYCRRCALVRFTCRTCGTERTRAERGIRWLSGQCRRCNAIRVREDKARQRRAAGAAERPQNGPKRKYI